MFKKLFKTEAEFSYFAKTAYEGDFVEEGPRNATCTRTVESLDKPDTELSTVKVTTVCTPDQNPRKKILPKN